MTRRGEPEIVDSRKLPIMRTLARLHECDAEAIFSRVDASELDVQDLLFEMVSTKEVELTRKPAQTFTLTIKGWGEYLKVLSSIYELPE